MDSQHLPSPLDDLTNTRLDTTVVLWLFTVDLALMSYECEAPETQFEKERRKSLRLVNRLRLYAVVYIFSQILSL